MDMFGFAVKETTVFALLFLFQIIIIFLAAYLFKELRKGGFV